MRRSGLMSSLSVVASVVLIGPVLVLGTTVGEFEDPAGQEIITKYLEAKQTQQQTLRGAQMQVDIDAKLLKLEKQGTMVALRTMSKLGKITYKALGFSGDNTVKTEVITRYLAAESESRDAALTPANYKFKYRGRMDREGQPVNIFQVTPRKKSLGMFRGEVWLDASTNMPVRETGHAVKTSSVLIKAMDFQQDYELHDGVAIPKHFHGTADIRIFGRAELSVDFSNFTRPVNAADEDGNPSIRY
jgi:hypothetical protein